MKIVFCLFKYFPYGGMQRKFYRIAQTCHQRGHQIHVLCLQWQGEQPSEFHVTVVNSKKSANHVRYREFATYVQRFVMEQQCDLLVGFNKIPGLDVYYAPDPCYQAKIKQRRLWHQLTPRYRTFKYFENSVFEYGNSCEILLLTEQQRTSYSEHYHTESERFHLLPPGITRDHCAPENASELRTAVRQEFGLGDDYLVLMIGSGFKTKGVDRAMHAIASLPTPLRERTQLMIIGQDNAKPFIRLAKQLKLRDNTHFLGGRSDITRFLCAAELLFHPAYAETAGNVLLEAMAAGLPILASAVCGYSYYINTANAGLLIPEPFQQTTCNQLLLQMLSESEHRKQWHTNGLGYAKTADIYSLPQHAAAIIEQIGTQRTISRNKIVGIKQFVNNPKRFDKVMALQGDIYKMQNSRRTLRFEVNNRGYFAKLHVGVGWPEIFKNLIQFRMPILSARNEWRAIQRLHELHINTMTLVDYGSRGINPARRQSYVITEELTNTISLENFCANWRQQPPNFTLKATLIRQVALLARKLHQNGINHRDFYICHILLEHSSLQQDSREPKLFLIDLHRVQIRNHTPLRWIIKDIGSLYFSIMHLGLSKRDLFRFMKTYHNTTLRQTLRQQHLWQAVQTRASQLYEKAYHELPTLVAEI